MTMSKDLQKHMAYESNRKSVGIAYLLWFLGFFGMHRFYSGNIKTGVAQLVLFLTGVGVAVLIPWLIVDLFLIPGMVRERNLETMRMLDFDTEEQREPESARPLPKPAQTEADRRREEMLEDLRQTGYRKERRDINPLYR